MATILVAGGCPNSTTASTLNDGLVAYYPFNGNANDESGNHHDGTVLEAQLTTRSLGSTNQCYSFNGSSFIKADAGGLPEGERTISFWFSSEAFAGAQMPTPLGYGGGFDLAGPSSFEIVFRPDQVGVHSHHGLFYETADTGSTTSYFNHLAITISSSSVAFYWNGKQLREVQALFPRTVTSGRELFIGVGSDGEGHGPFVNPDVGFFSGLIDDIRIYNRALTKAEISEIYKLEAGDSDTDGLSDADETETYHTDPHKADTDGDGVNDGTEVRAGTNPNDPASFPERINALAAIELEIFTKLGVKYQMEVSTDLTTWSNSGDPFDGSGGSTYKLISARGEARTFYRLTPLK